MQVPVSAASLPNNSNYENNNYVDINQLDVASFRKLALDSTKAEKMAQFFRWLDDAGRLQILSLLAQRDLCLEDFVQILEAKESIISERLSILRSLKLVGYSKRGGKVYYRLLDRRVLDFYKSVTEHLNVLNTEVL